MLNYSSNGFYMHIHLRYGEQRVFLVQLVSVSEMDGGSPKAKGEFE
jgi:hypothetical protein